MPTQTGRAARRAGGFGRRLERFEKAHSRLGGQVFVVVIVYLDHWGVDAGSEAFYLGECEQSVFGCFAGVDAEVVFDGFHDCVGAAASELTRGLEAQISNKYAVDYGTGRSRTDRGACLEMESADRRSVVHCVEGSNLIDSHRGHLQDPSNLVHDADTREAMLPLSKIEKRHHRRFLVLWGVAFEDLIDQLLVEGVELERDLGVVVRSVSMLPKKTLSAQDSTERGPRPHTTCSTSLATRAVTERFRH